MSTPYTGIDAFPTTIPLPDDGDAKTAASVNVAIQGNRDALIYLANLLGGAHPGGTLKNFTLKGNTTIRNDGSDDDLTLINLEVTIDDQTNILSRAVWNVSEGSWAFGGGGGQFITYACPTFFSQPVSFDGAGRLRRRRQYTATGNFDRVISAASTDVYIVQGGEITTGNKGLVQNGTADGSLTSWDVIRIVSQDTTPFPLYHADAVTAIEDPAGSNIVMVRNPTNPGEYSTVLLMWNGAFWEMIGQ